MRLNVDMFNDVPKTANIALNALVQNNKHMFTSHVELTSKPPGFFDEAPRTICVMEYKDVAMVLEFSDSSRLSVKVLTSHGWGWLPTAYLQGV